MITELRMFLSLSFARESGSNGNGANVDNSGKYLNLIKVFSKQKMYRSGFWVEFGS
jgi:hypothetical protein